MLLPENAVVRRINELVKRARSVKVHAYIIHYLRKQMPYVMGKQDKQVCGREEGERYACGPGYLRDFRVVLGKKRTRSKYTTTSFSCTKSCGKRTRSSVGGCADIVPTDKTRLNAYSCFFGEKGVSKLVL